VLTVGGEGELTRGDLRKRLEEFVETFELPVLTSPGAKGLFPESHRLSLRNYGMAACEWPHYYLQPSKLDPKLPSRYDCLMVLASSLGEYATNIWNDIFRPAGPLLQVDLDQGVIGRDFPTHMGIVAEIGHFLDELIEAGQKIHANQAVFARYRKGVDARKKLVKRITAGVPPFRDPDKCNSTADPILPQALMTRLGAALPEGSHVFIDGGNCIGWAMHYLKVDPPTQIHSSLSMGPMGFGIGAVIGAKLGAPEHTCVAIAGDGAFLMHGSEVSTAFSNKAGVVIVVLCDNRLNMVDQGMNHLYPNDQWLGVFQLGNPDLKLFAESLGATAYKVSSPSAFSQAFSQAVAQADATHLPQVIVVCIDRNEIPPYYPASTPACSPSGMGATP
jgi:acetolactate synthase-1/2/3 large subunit